jgi:hypothetical protein
MTTKLVTQPFSFLFFRLASGASKEVLDRMEQQAEEKVQQALRQQKKELSNAFALELHEKLLNEREESHQRGKQEGFEEGRASAPVQRVEVPVAAAAVATNTTTGGISEEEYQRRTEELKTHLRLKKDEQVKKV